MGETIQRIKRVKLAGIYEMVPSVDGEYVSYALHAAKVAELERLREFKADVIQSWGEGVCHGFGDYWDTIKCFISDDEQRQAINAADAAEKSER